jgi:hypothetical protein
MDTSSLSPSLSDALKADLGDMIGLDALPEAERAATLMKIGDVIFQMVLLRVFSELGDQGQKELEDFIADPKNTADPEAFYGFLRGKLPDLDEIVAEEVAAFKRDAIGTMGAR